MIERGFWPDFSREALQELEHLQIKTRVEARNLRELLWVSIDNVTSRDLDQLTYAEPGKIYVAVADVDELVKKNSMLDKYAAHNTTTVYTPCKIFPMLPAKLSNDLTSLNENEDRCAIVVEMKVAEDGRFDLQEVYHAWVRNKAKLNYPFVADLLEHPDDSPLHQQLVLQDSLAQKILQYRNQRGALEFGTIQLEAVLENDRPIRLEESRRNRAHRLIENYMIAANVAVTRHLTERGVPMIRRVVKTPRRWDRIVSLARQWDHILPPVPNPKALRAFLLEAQEKDPLQFSDLSLAIIKLLGRGEYVLSLPGQAPFGHFDLAEHEYTHATAPNRRFPDLIIQRLLKHKKVYTPAELSALATHCTAKEDDAAKVERRLLKCAAAYVLQNEVGKTFDAMVTGAAPKGTWVRIREPHIEGKLVKGFEKVDVGDYIQVKLIRVDIKNGHIDFALLR